MRGSDMGLVDRLSYEQDGLEDSVLFEGGMGH